MIAAQRTKPKQPKTLQDLQNLFAGFVGYLSVNVWGRLSSSAQLAVSRRLSKVLEWRISRHFIPLYCALHYGDYKYHKKFHPGRGKSCYESFQDFFTREFKETPTITTKTIWPCEGLLCDSVGVSHAEPVKIKGELRHIRTIFGEGGSLIPDDYHFTNVFLHNNNYHHIHAPVSGKILRIEHIPGDLLLLRPWAYKNAPSLPALRNERINVDIIDDETKQRWFVSIIGGPVVATIKLVEKLKVGAHFNRGEKLGGFLLGSTCCVASPKVPEVQLNQNVQVGEPY